MKKFFIVLLALSSFSVFAANKASLEYSCDLDGQTRSGKVEIDDQLVVGKASCMHFGKGPTLCFRFERHVRINDIHLALRTSDQLQSGLSSNFISLGNIPYTEGGVSITPIKVGALKKEDLNCTYSNVQWKR